MTASPRVLEAEEAAAAPASVVAALFAASFAAVYLEVSLMKLVSVMFYTSFVYAIIGVALLGYGAAGSVLALRGSPLAADAPTRLGRCLVAFALSVVPAFLVVNAIDVPEQQLFGTLSGLLLLLVVYALLVLPFFFMGLAIASTFAAFAGDVNRLYFADLLGAGAGGALALASVPWLGGVPLCAVAGLVAALAGVVALRAGGARPRAALAAGALDVALLAILLGPYPIAVRVASDKHGPILSRAAKPGGLATTFSRWSVFGRVDITEPFATLPPQFGGDVSPVFQNLRVEQRMLLLDGAAPAFLYRVRDSPAELGFLAGTSQSPAYRLRARPRVLVIGVGGATDVLIALAHDAAHVTAVELNPVSVHGVRDVYGDYVGNVLRDPRVRVVVAEGRNFAARSRDLYDIVQLSGVDTGAALGAFGLGITPESHIYTVEAVRDLLARLAPEGMLSITRDLQLGWALRLAAVAREALVAEGLEPASRIAVLEGKQYGWATLLVKRTPFTAEETGVLEGFAAEYRFPLAYHPLAAGTGAFDRVIRAGAASDGDYDLRPPTDDWPFLFLSLRWSRLPRLLGEGRKALGNPLVFLFLFLCVNLIVLAVLAVALIGWPLLVLPPGAPGAARSGPVIAYFAALGAGFMLGEVALMQRFTVFLGNPVLAVATVLAALLVSSGIGSYVARGRERRLSAVFACVVVALLVFATPALPALLHALLPLPLALRISVCVALVAVLGVPMGMPFPAGLARVAARAPALVPWAWGINGMVSVVASLASYLIGILVGYSTMFVGAAAVYLIALASSRRL